LKQVSNRHKIVLIISDSNDPSNPDTAGEAARLAGSSDVPIYGISVTTPSATGITQVDAQSDETLLGILAKQSGARHFTIADANDIPKLATVTRIEWRNSYLLGYQPSNTSRDGKYREIRVTLLPPRGIRQLNSLVRPGYFARAQER